MGHGWDRGVSKSQTFDVSLEGVPPFLGGLGLGSPRRELLTPLAASILKFVGGVAGCWDLTLLRPGFKADAWIVPIGE